MRNNCLHFPDNCEDYFYLSCRVMVNIIPGFVNVTAQGNLTSFLSILTGICCRCIVKNKAPIILTFFFVEVSYFRVSFQCK